MVDLSPLLEPISEDNPAGEDLRYDPVSDAIKEARRADDPLDRGDWQQELKTSDWLEVVKLTRGALEKKGKDLQVAVWLVEGLTYTDGFEGFAAGCQFVRDLMETFWDTLHPVIEDEDDFELRAARLEFLNNNGPFALSQVPVTDPRESAGYNFIQYQESRDVGYEGDARNPEARREKIEDGKTPPEEFDKAVLKTSKAFYAKMAEDVGAGIAAFEALDQLVDERFERDAPRLSDLGTTLKEIQRLANRLLAEKREKEPDPEPEPKASKKMESGSTGEADAPTPSSETGERPRIAPPVPPASPAEPTVPGPGRPVLRFDRLAPPAAAEAEAWAAAADALDRSGIRSALEILMVHAQGAPSVRDRTRFRLLMAKLCLEAERPDLARPIAEELHALVEELALERWESPLWIADLYETLYKCLTAGEPTSDDEYKAAELLRKLCTTDVTRAIGYRV
ncbi:MAG: type VI secretion system protein TssA [Desulfococcaceae bacterium]